MGRYIPQGPTVILNTIFQSSNQGGSTAPWSYYPTTYKHVLVSIQVLFSVYRFDRTVEWLTQMVSGSKSVPLYTQGTWGIKYVPVLSNVEPFEYDPWKYTSQVRACA